METEKLAKKKKKNGVRVSGLADFGLSVSLFLFSPTVQFVSVVFPGDSCRCY